MEIKLKLDKETFIDQVTSDDLCDEDDFAITEHAGYIVVSGKASNIRTALGELGNSYNDVDALIVK